MKKVQLDFILNPQSNSSGSSSEENTLSNVQDEELDNFTPSSFHSFPTLPPSEATPTSLPQIISHRNSQNRPSSGSSISSTTSSSAKPKRKRIRKIYICQHENCNSAAVSKNRCVRHGGGTRCSVYGCEKGAKMKGKCFHHGGYKSCAVDGCTSKAKRYGYCWSHGGGQPCQIEDCAKVATLGGFCWAHGGGNRCRIDGCDKRSYQKHDYLCKIHYISYHRKEDTKEKEEEEDANLVLWGSSTEEENQNISEIESKEDKKK